MTIHLVSETIDAKRAPAGALFQLVWGIYVDQGVDADSAIVNHAIRITHQSDIGWADMLLDEYRHAII